MKHLDGTSVLVLGLGESGLAMARWCARFGAQVRVWDSREAPPRAVALAEHLPAAQLLRGRLTDDAFCGVQLILKSPGLSPLDALIAAPLERAAEAGVPVQGELELFARALAALKAERGYAPKVLAITGTNGKTTTTAMTAQLIERAGRRVAVAGNIGPTMLQTLADALDSEPVTQVVTQPATQPATQAVAGGTAQSPHTSPLPHGEGATQRVDETPADFSDAVKQEQGTGQALPPLPLGEGNARPLRHTQDDDAFIEPAPPPAAVPIFEHLPEVWVLELSSFQLDEAKGFEPSAAAVLNITEDHLDWHGSMAAYVAAKARVFGKAAVMVVNRDDVAVERMVPAPERLKPGARGNPGRRAITLERAVVRFGLSAPRLPGDFGLIVDHGMAWLVRALDADEPTPRKRARAAPAPGARSIEKFEAEPDVLQLQRLMPADALRVRGRHNAANALAALALATAIGCPLAPMLHGLREYAGEAHRVEHLATIDGVDAFDDSKGTNVGATVAALEGLGADRDTEHTRARLVVILGGDGKGQDFAPLVEPVRRHVRAVATLGRDAPRIEIALAAVKDLTLQRHATLEAATRWAFAQAVPGDAVLLSPACASLDMFRNYAHRAEVFSAEVRAIAADAGVPA